MADSESRRTLLRASAALLLSPGLRAGGQAPGSGSPNLAAVTLYTEAGVQRLERSGERWTSQTVELQTVGVSGGISLRLRSPQQNPVRLHLRWATTFSADQRFLGDAWERSYGDLAFRSMEPERVMPWYFLATDGKTTQAFGVRTGASAFCLWQVDPEGISLWCDVRNGGHGVQLGGRDLAIGEVVVHRYSEGTAFQAAQQFCGLLCPKPRLPQTPVYGGNNWYYAYGKSSASDILADSERIAELSSANSNRPWMVIDDGWAPNDTAGPWRAGNAKFPDMPKLAADMQKAGVRPGIWTRPLFTRGRIPGPALRPFTLDPTVPEAAAMIADDLKTVVAWGYQLVKHDFSSFDLLGRWGFQMNADVTDGKQTFHDRTKTNAEIVRGFYELLRHAAGETPLLGCNTVGHLSAGLFELQRIGDDTSGRDWNRTRKMGVNTLAFRLPQHNAFFAIDADCVGLTKRIDWKYNRQWLDVLARSGSPLFVSIAPDALGPEQKKAIADAFSVASTLQPVAEPLDWLTNNQPQQWMVGGEKVSYDWFGSEGVSPFAS